MDRALQQSSIDSQLFVQNRDLCLSHLHSTPPLGGPRRNIAMTFGAEKRRIIWLSDCEKILKIQFTCFDRIHERDRQTDRWTDRQTDRRTPHDGIGSAMHSIARQKLTLTCNHDPIRLVKGKKVKERIVLREIHLRTSSRVQVCNLRGGYLRGLSPLTLHTYILTYLLTYFLIYLLTYFYYY